MLLKTILFSSPLLAAAPLFSQNLSAYTDYKNYFHVFDNGVSKQLEYLPAQWYKTGGNAVVYLDNSNTLKAYYKGEKQVLSEAAPTECFVNDEMIVYRFGNALNVFDKGNTVVLSGWASHILVSDSMVGCVDQNENVYKIYYNGHIHTLPDMLDNNSIASFSMGDNIIAYTGMNGYLRIYYRNHVFNTEAYQPKQYKASSGTVAFENESTQEFSVFYKGVVTVLEQQIPRSFQVADDMVAYVDYSGSFKVFYNGVTTELLSFAPQDYTADDNLLVYSDDVTFTAFFNGKIYTLGRNIPKTYKTDFSTLAYTDPQGFLNVFYAGKTDCVCSEKAVVYDLSGNTVKYTNSMNETRFLLNGKRVLMFTGANKGTPAASATR